MASVVNSVRIEFSATLTLTETELRALDALVGYGDDAFIGAFKEKLGASYIRNCEGGLRSAFDAIRRDVKPALSSIDQARRDLSDALKRRAEASAPDPR